MHYGGVPFTLSANLERRMIRSVGLISAALALGARKVSGWVATGRMTCKQGCPYIPASMQSIWQRESKAAPTRLGLPFVACAQPKQGVS